MNGQEGEGGLLRRREVVAGLLARRGGALLVTGLGSTSWDAAAAGDDEANFYLWGGMGGASMVGLGLALARPGQRVLVVTGDGEMLMGAGALATIAVQAPRNLAVVVIDNEIYGETGRQRTHTAQGADLAAMGAAAGLPLAMTVRTAGELERAYRAVLEAEGPVLAVVKVGTEPVPLVLPPRDGALLKDRFRHALTGRVEPD